VREAKNLPPKIGQDAFCFRARVRTADCFVPLTAIWIQGFMSFCSSEAWQKSSPVLKNLQVPGFIVRVRSFLRGILSHTLSVVSRSDAQLLNTWPKAGLVRSPLR